MIEWINERPEEKDHIFYREITQDEIVLKPSLRDLCKSNQCGQYGTNWMCPPGVGTYEEVTEELRSCGDGILMQMIYQTQHSFDVDGWKKAFELFDCKLQDVIAEIANHIPRKQLLYLGGGSCRVCEECTMKTGEPCRHPDQAIASVEAYGVEVNSTVVNVGLKYNNGPNTVSNVAIIS